jgi:protein SCO1/2
LTGALDDLERVWQEYGVYREVRDEASAAGYLVDHTARIYVIDGAGDWRLTYPYNVESSGVVQDLRHLALERR